jgi:hypothetical protein
MDPDANLKEQLYLCKVVYGSADDPDAVRLAELVEALHEWIASGGFLPKPWQQEKQP